MYPFINLGPVAIPTKPFLYLVAIWVGLALLEKTADRLNQDRAILYSLASQSLLFGVIGARIVFVMTHWSAFANNWTTIFWPLNTGYSIWGGLLIGSALLVVNIRAQKLSYGQIIDAATPTILLVLAAIFLADFFAGPGYGTAFNWGRLQFHPVQFYELFFVTMAGVAWWWFHLQRPFPGSTFLLSTAVLSFGLLLVNPFRGNTWTTSAGWLPLQVIYLLITLACLFILMFKSPKRLVQDPT